MQELGWWSLLPSRGREGYLGHLPTGLALGGSRGSAQPHARGTDGRRYHTHTRPSAHLTETHGCAHPQALRLLLLPHNQGSQEIPLPWGVLRHLPFPPLPKHPSSPCALEISRPSHGQELLGRVWLDVPDAEPGDPQAGQLWPGPPPAL